MQSLAWNCSVVQVVFRLRSCDKHHWYDKTVMLRNVTCFLGYPRDSVAGSFVPQSGERGTLA